MAYKATNPVLRAAATGLGNVSIWQASDTRDIATHLAEVQTNFVARRTRLQPSIAKVVAELVFQKRRAA